MYKMSETCHRYAILRSQLDELGYLQPLPKDGIRLVDKLLADLLKTTESLQYYKALSNSLTNERDTLLIGTQPYKSDNAKLVCELNDLNLELLKIKEESEYSRKQLESEIRYLRKKKDSMAEDKKVLLEKIQKLELECASQANEILQYNDGKGKSVSKSTANSKRPVSKYSVGLKTDSGISLTEGKPLKDICKLRQRCHELEEDLQNVLDNKHEQLEVINCLKQQIKARDEEIVRLSSLLKGGRIHALCNDYSNKPYYTKHNELKKLQDEAIELEMLLKEAVEKQHETMTRNLALVERNKQLEKELHEIDQIALNVEKQCNDTIEQKKLCIQNVQDKLNKSLDRSRDLERQLMTLRSENEDLLGELKSFRNKQQTLSVSVQTGSDAAYEYHHRPQQEEDKLISKIDELTEKNIELQKKISKMEEHILDLSKPLPNNATSVASTMRENCCSRHGCESQTSFEQQSMSSKHFTLQKHCYPAHMTDNHMGHTQHTHASWRRCLDNNFPYKNMIKSPFCRDNCICNKCYQSIINFIRRLEREKDVIQSSIVQVETERDTLKRRLEISTEMQVSEQSRIKQSTIENQNRICLLESEQQALLKNKDNQTAIIGNLEQQCAEMKERLSLQEKETSHHRLKYNQLKIIHEQIERTFSSTQQQLTEAENKLSGSLERLRTLEHEHQNLEEDCKTSKMDLVNTKTALEVASKKNITLMNELDEKSLELDKLRKASHGKSSELTRLQKTVADLEKRLNEASQNRDGAQHLLSRTASELEQLRKEVNKLQSDCEQYSLENRRLQDELSTVTCNLRSTLRDLENSRKESADLQQQLQQYVDRVRHAEDIITMKEQERSELLEQFRSLSMEATALETNNHTLASSMVDNRMRLHETDQRAEDLEACLQAKEAALQECRIEAADLRSRIVTLEAEADHYKQSLRRTKDDLMSLREVCVDLDKQKDTLALESGRLHSDRYQTEQEVEEIRMERDSLRQDLDREQSAKEGLQSLLETSRREAIDQRLIVQELNRELSELRNRVQELMSKLETEREQVRRYQAQAHEYSVQVQELRRQITNERYRMSQIDEERLYFPTL